MHKFEIQLAGRPFAVETGRIAKQASGSVIVTYGDTTVLVAATAMDEERDVDFMPLTVDYQEMAYAAGRIPGSFFRREIGRPSEKETLTSRVIDRPIRPLFPKGYRKETQVVATVMSVDPEIEPDVMALTGASAALHISDVPFLGPIAGVRVGRLNGQLVLNPSRQQWAESDLNVIVAGSRESIVMVEGGARLVDEDSLLEAIFFAHEQMQPLLDLQDRLREAAGKPKREVVPPPRDEALIGEVEAEFGGRIEAALLVKEKMGRHAALHGVKEAMAARLEEKVGEAFAGRRRELGAIWDELERKVMRQYMMRENVRIDGRRFDEVRPIWSEVGVLPRAHGSAVFTRGETQVLTVTTLGSADDEQKIESLTGSTFKSFMLHYNFPPYSVGEAKKLRGPGRREIGHGALAERVVSAVLPSAEIFPYTVRVVSDVQESNGSSSMATVCGAALSLMDAGVPISAPVAGIAMGLVKEGDRSIVVSDILGDEDHSGDMDFKIAGTATGVAGIQMDIKVIGVTKEILRQGLYQARAGRQHILEKMNEVLTQPRSDLSPYAPRIISFDINPDKIREVIGPGGKIIKGIVAETGVKIDVEDSGRVNIISADSEAAARALAIIKDIVREVEIGAIYEGTVRKIMDFGAFVEVIPGTDGLVHISQLDHRHVKKVTDVVREGDKVLVKVLGIDERGKISLSRKAALPESARLAAELETEAGGGEEQEDRGPRRPRARRRED
ncbi:MAG: polyribonucleotide nucleotidyltransferase [Pseudomonadota bacterium]